MTIAKYPLSMRVLHWVLGAAVVAVWLVGTLMGDMAPSDQKWMLYANHKAVGIVILVLMLVRLANRRRQTLPAPLPAKPLEQRLAVAVHYGFYLALILMPLSGYLMSVFGGYPVTLWGLPVPALFTPDKSVAGLFKDAHEVLANVILVLFVLHIAGVIKHIWHRQHPLRRMW